MNEQEHTELEIVPLNAIEAIERAQVDVQVATARRFPRQLSAVKNRMMSFALLDEETAASCFYTLPARKGGDGKPLRGPSVRLAEIALASYQHVKAASRIIADDGKFITAQAVVHDLENNVSVAIEVKRRVTTKDGKRFGDDMIAVTGNAATSIALRNAVFRVVPRALINPVYDAARELAVGNVKSLVAKRAKVVERLNKLGVTTDRLLAVVGAAKVEDIDLDKMETLIGLGSAVHQGETTLEAAFPIPGQDDKEEPVAPKFNTRKKPTVTPDQQQPTNTAPAEEKPLSEPPVASVDAPPVFDDLSVLQSQLSTIVIEKCGASFDTFQRAMESLKWVENSNAWIGFGDIPDTVCQRLIGAERGLIVEVKKLL